MHASRDDRARAELIPQGSLARGGLSVDGVDAHGIMSRMNGTKVTTGLLCVASVLAVGCGTKAGSADLLEAKNTVGAILRGAREAYEREQLADELVPDSGGGAQFSHALCKSAKPFPATMPSEGKKEQPSAEEFKATSATNDRYTGWMCLRFEQHDPVRFQYSYNAGGGYKSPARGGRDPGPNGFEACAEADFEKGGPTTLVCATGVVDQKALTIKTDTEPFIASE